MTKIDGGAKGITKEQVWAAGVLSVMGSLAFVEPKNSQKKFKPYIKLQLRTTRTDVRDSFLRLADVIGADMTEGLSGGIYNKPFWQLVITGAPLHTAMTLLWPELIPSRKREYARLRLQLKEWGEKE